MSTHSAASRRLAGAPALAAAAVLSALSLAYPLVAPVVALATGSVALRTARRTASAWAWTVVVIAVAVTIVALTIDLGLLAVSSGPVRASTSSVATAQTS